MEARTMGAAEFKAKCLRVMDRVRDTRVPVVLTKKGVPIARLVPIDPPRQKNVFGALKGKFRIHGDIVGPVVPAEEWQK